MKIRVNTLNTNSVSVNTQSNNEVIAVGIQGPAGPNVLSQATDVDVTNLNHGSILVYKTNTSKWTSTTTLDAQNMEGGEF